MNLELEEGAPFAALRLAGTVALFAGFGCVWSCALMTAVEAVPKNGMMQAVIYSQKRKHSEERSMRKRSKREVKNRRVVVVAK